MTRREALAGMALLGAQAEKPANVGIIGLGLRSGAHLNALKKLSGARVAALCDLDSQRIVKANAGLAGKAEAYTDYRELLRDRNVGVVVIVTPGYLHHEMALAALRAGKDVLIEKPLALDYAGAMEIVRESKRSGRVVAVGMQRRYTRSDAAIQRLVDGGAIGALRFIASYEFRGDWNPNSWQYTDPATGKRAIWRYLSKTAGSSELEFSIHGLAMATGLVKSPLTRVAASGGVLHYDGRDTRDYSAITADFASGARLSYTFSCFAPGGGTNIVITGDRGVLRRGEGQILLSTGSRKPQPVPIPADIPGEDAEVLMYREFLRDVRDRRPSALSPEAALEPAKIAYAADLSIRQNRIVKADDFA